MVSIASLKVIFHWLCCWLLLS